MLITGHQPNFIPYPGFFHKIIHSDMYVVVDNVQFVKRGPFGWIHRNKIKTNNGWMWLTVPVKTKGRYLQKINEVEIDNSKNWAEHHIRAIKFNYKNAPFFNLYFSDIQAVFQRKWTYISDLNICLIKMILKFLNIDAIISIASEHNIKGKSSRLIINICNKFNSTEYLSGQHGKDYIDMSLCEQSGINIHFQDFIINEYPQQYSSLGFISNLSILDMLFNCGEDTSSILKEIPAYA